MVEAGTRRLGPRCRAPYEPTAEERAALGLAADAPAGTWYRKQGCPACGGSGYKGRTGIFELLEINEPIRQAIMAGQTAEHIRNLARATAGMKTMREDAVLKVQEGVTSAEEVFRVTLDE